MKMKKIYIAMLMAAFSLTAVQAQDNTKLTKEITLEKDIAPLEKKAVKKNELPKVKKPATTGKKTQLGYSDLTSPIEVPTSIPTLLPYGYRTAHNFSDKRGYLDVGAGTQANFRVDFGYRLIDEEREKLGVWLNHNSTWNGKNSSKAITLDENRNKQKYNDNTLAVDYSKGLGNGTLTLGAKAHIDIYNYYGGWNTSGIYDPNNYDYGISYVMRPYDWDKEKQTFTDFNLNAGWKSQFMLRDNPLNYHVGLQYGHAAYDKSFNSNYKHGAHDNWGILNLGGSYDLNELTTAALNIKGEYLRRGSKANDSSTADLFDEAAVTAAPSGGADGSAAYDVPPEALSDERFRRMLSEAEKYLGMPYVWGGSSPSTSFDCSGFISWVINNSGNGWNVGRQTAEGLRRLCTPVAREEARPGDLVFFQGTYNTSGASHVGLYVGDGMMVHAGKPIQYSNINTPYWNAHYMQYGRLP